jgi:uracil-DNA glycosylase family 4
MSKFEEMKAVRDELFQDSSLPLFEYRTSQNYFPVIGEGSHDAKILFIGEAPGENEAKTGRPFCGRAGKVLDQLLAHIGVERKDVYITNIVKDRPPGNRDPETLEIDSYSKYLDKQIEIIKPKVIATLGRFSMVYIMNKLGLSDVLGPIGKMHGKKFETDASYGKIFVIPLYHPAVAVYDASKLEELKWDFEILKESI